MQTIPYPISESPNQCAAAGFRLTAHLGHIFSKPTTEENLQVGLQARDDGIRSILKSCFRPVSGIDEHVTTKRGRPSLGQHQQLAIGREIVGSLQVLSLDQPIEGIQPVVGVWRRLAADHSITAVLVEHYLDYVREFGHVFSRYKRWKRCYQRCGLLTDTRDYSHAFNSLTNERWDVWAAQVS